MKNRGTNILLALFFAGLAALWAADYARVPTRKELDRRKGRVLVELIDARPDDVRKIELLGGPEPLVFERREGNKWQMTSPLDVAADPSMVENLAFRLKELSKRPEADTLEGDAASFGLAPPARTVKVWGAATDAPMASLDVGKTSLDRRYVRRGGESGVDVVDAQGLSTVELSPAKWRDRELFRVPTFEVDAVTLSGTNRDLKLRRGPDSWRIVDPIKALAVESKVDGLIADLGMLRVTEDSRFVADNVADADLDRYGLKNPTVTVEVEAGRDGKRRPAQVLHVGKPVEGKPGLLYARRGDQDDVVAVDGRTLAGLGLDPNAYRSPKVADITPSRVVHFQVQAEGEKPFDVMRSGDDWLVVRPNAAGADRQAVEAFLKGLDGLQTEIYLTPGSKPDSGVDHPSVALKVWQRPDPRVGGPSSEEPVLSLRIGRRDAATRSVYAQVEGDRTILALPDTVDSLFPRNTLSLRERTVLAEPTDQIERLIFSGQGRRVALNAPVVKLDPLRNGPVGWWMVEPTEGPADPGAVGRLLKVLGGLRAEGLVVESPKDLAEFGLKEPTLTLTWATPYRDLPKPGEPTSPSATNLAERSLLVGSLVTGKPGSRYATIAGRPLVFTIAGDVVTTLDAEYRDHQVLSFDPSRARKVHLRWPDRGFDLLPTGQAAGKTWATAGPVDAPRFDPTKASALVKEASNLQTNRYAQYEGPFLDQTGLASPRVSIRFEFDDASPPKTLIVGAEAGNGLVYATTAAGNKGPVFTLPRSIVAEWLNEPARRVDLMPENVFAPE